MAKWRQWWRRCPDPPMGTLSNILLATCAAITIFIGLIVITVICLRLFPILSHLIIEPFLVAVIVLWASIPLATSNNDLALNIAFYAILLFSTLHFIAYQTIFAFWITLAVLVLLVLIEHSRRSDDEPIYTKIAQLLAVGSLIVFVLRHFTAYFLPSLQVALEAQFAFLFQLAYLREIIASSVGLIILYATAVNTLARFRIYQWHEFLTPPNRDNALALILYDIVYYVGNCLRIVGWAFFTVITELINYIFRTFFSPHLFRTMLYIISSAGLSALLIKQIIFIQPDLANVLHNTEPFFAPPTLLFNSYFILGGVFFLTAAEVAALTVIWLPRGTSRDARRPAYQNLTATTAGIVICMWSTAFTAWVVNNVFHLDDEQFVALGYFTSLAIIFVFWAVFTQMRSGTLPAQQVPTDTTPKV